MADRVHQLLATDVALDKLGARHITAAEAEQLLRNPQPSCATRDRLPIRVSAGC